MDDLLLTHLSKVKNDNSKSSRKRGSKSQNSTEAEQSAKEVVTKSSHRSVKKAGKGADIDSAVKGVKGNIRDRDYLREARRDIRRKKKEIKRDLKIKEILNQPLEKSFSRKSLARIKKIAKKK